MVEQKLTSEWQNQEPQWTLYQSANDIEKQHEFQG